MYLSRLEIFGFKTFAQKVDLHFDDGITNIVGPNGCGKSNIVDALRWALGEQKSSVLRSEKMENVIFNGTKLRKPLNVSEVSLTIQNTKNILPTEYTEVTITRRLYRSGESEYYLNRLPCRLKDINDLFMDTGMGADAYSVIELKMVEQILSDNTEDRRKLFEEAAGITKYKVRRRQTFRKLDTTKQDLTRVNDIVTEIEKKVNSLKRQTQKAKRYTRLTAQLKQEDVTLGLFQYRRLTDLMTPLSDQLHNLERIAEQLHGDTAKKESEVEVMNTQLIAREQALRDIQLRLEEQDRSMKSVEEVILVSRERTNYLQDLIRRYADEKTVLAERRDLLLAQITQLTADITTLRTDYETQSVTLDARKSALSQSEQTMTARREALESVRRDSVQLIDEGARKRSAVQLLRNNIQNLDHRIAELEKESRRHQEQSGDSRSAIDEHQDALKRLTQEADQTRADIVQREKAIEDRRRQIDTLRSDKWQAEAEIKTLASRLVIIQKAFESHEGFPESVRFLLENRSAGMQHTVADLMATDEAYRKALETALGDSFAYIVSSDGSAVRNALAQLTEHDKGTATFVDPAALPTRTETPAPEALAQSIIGHALTLVRCDDAGLAAFLLGDVLFVKDLDQATQLAARHPTWRFVTLAGELVKGKYLIRGGRRAKSTDSLIGQRELLRHLQSQLDHFQQETLRLDAEIAREEQALEAQKADLAVREAEMSGVDERLVQLDKSISQQAYEQKRSQETLIENAESLEQAQQERASLQEQLNLRLPEIDQLEGRRQELEIQTRALETQVAELERERKDRSTAVNEFLSGFLRLEGDIRNKENQVASCHQQIADTEETAAKHDVESRNATAEIQRIAELVRAKEGELVTLTTARETIEKERDREETEVARVREDTAKVEAELKKVRRQREDLLNSRHAIEQQHSDLRFELRALTERIQRDYEFDLTRDALEASVEEPVDPKEEEELAYETVAGEPPESAAAELPVADVLATGAESGGAAKEFDPAVSQAVIDDLRRKIKMLGPVNMEAFAEFQIEKERWDTLVKQRADLLEAESQLLQTITTINATAERQFMAVFEKIRENFNKIFTGLFVEGEADLRLADGGDILEANIDILARPTGKKIQYIALLSGGEKTLTAIALLFAIYLVKPSPFCILDEVDAPLDDTNIDKFTKILKDFSSDTQFIVVTHNKRTMESAANIFGITMQEAGVSKVVSVKFGERDEAGRPDDIEELIRRNQVEVLSHEIKDPPADKAGNA